MNGETEEISVWAKLVSVAKPMGKSDIVLTYKPLTRKSSQGDSYLTLCEKDEERAGQKIRKWKEIHCSPDITFVVTVSVGCKEFQNWVAILNATCISTLLGKMAWHTFLVSKDTNWNTTSVIETMLISIAEEEQ